VMSSCEKCWSDAYRLMMSGGFESQTDAYRHLLSERANNPCGNKEQAGQYWDEEKQIDSRFLEPKPSKDERGG